MEDEQDKMIKAAIAEYGFFVAGFEATDYLPAFALSIGLWEKYQHPEVICFGLQVQALQQLVADIAEGVREGEKVEPGVEYDMIFEESRATFIKVDPRNIRDYFGAAIDFYKGADFPAVQLIWTDRNDAFPWEDGFEEEFRFRQPLLDRNAEFKFYEATNLGAYTSRQWLDEKKPILQVVHDPDGDWQFLTGEEVADDVRVIALEEIIRTDLTLNEVFDLEYGEMAQRTAVGEPWMRDTFEFDEEE